jgi:hypothetical protein
VSRKKYSIVKKNIQPLPGVKNKCRYVMKRQIREKGEATAIRDSTGGPHM